MVSQDFDYVIKRYCRDGPGNFLVGQGDYQIIRANNSKKIDPFEFVNATEPEMTLEMSIILRQRTPGQNNKETCPQCKYINSTPTQTHEWQVPISLFTYVMINVISHSRGCFGQFQIEEEVLGLDGNNDKNSEKVQGITSYVSFLAVG